MMVTDTQTQGRVACRQIALALGENNTLGTLFNLTATCGDQGWPAKQMRAEAQRANSQKEADSLALSFLPAIQPGPHDTAPPET